MVVTARVCVLCGAVYSTPGMTSFHRKATGHEHFKTVKRTVERKPSIISYNPCSQQLEQR